MSDNWIVQNIQNALDTWNSQLADIWNLVTQTPETFKGGAIWNVIKTIHGGMQAIGLALLVLFFVVGVMKTCGSLTEVKKPEHALRLFIRFAIAKIVVTYGMDLMLAIFRISQGMVSKIMSLSNISGSTNSVLPSSIISASSVESVAIILNAPRVSSFSLRFFCASIKSFIAE